MRIRALDRVEDVVVPGTMGSSAPFFSPDGQWMGFAAGGQLKKVGLMGGPPTTLARLQGALLGASWSSDGTIVFATAGDGGLFRVSAAGGDPNILTKPDAPGAGEDHAFPFTLPNGRGVLFTTTAFSRQADFQVAVLDLKNGQVKKLLVGSHPQYVESGWILYAVEGALRAVRFDPERLEVVGEPTLVADDLTGPFFDVARDGTMVAAVGGLVGNPETSDRSLVWVDRQGREEPVGAPSRAYASRRLQISPDGSRFVTDIGGDLWIWEFSRRTLTRLTFDPTEDWYPAWSADGRRIFFASGKAGNHPLAWIAADGTGVVTRVGASPMDQFPQTVTPDGKTLVFRQQAGITGSGDLYALALDAQGGPKPLMETPFVERNASLSPDGRWMAYDSNQSGRFEVYVRPFPDVAGGQWQISGDGGAGPIWARSGRELFYIAGDLGMMSVTVKNESGFVASVPTRLFDASSYYYVSAGPGGSYDISPDGGRRFIMVKTAQRTPQASQARLAVTTHWVEDIQSRVPKQ